ncbi:enoyl-CoA hydratase/isomerase family protein [Caballeronia sp. LZ035]|uniref:enoyl-CoA hydratase/isomerase family protein n=1 Tax=Caballeronia sp. LZ035 TaxID=3038568 RepID=UPI002859827E|nr:enoyl-CoA hydratase/isomerase family protein [Caballeronia sp. LZ035]MDR5760844.1 enoyl-CoA hydratase/isomerase family protein [Caballeronia sp. LZ035]
MATLADHGACPDRFGHLEGFRVETNQGGSRVDIVLDRPPLNLISLRQGEHLSAVFSALDTDPAVRVIVVRAEGEHFSSGGDVDGVADATPAQRAQLALHMDAPSRCSKLVIAANRGYCFGTGFELSLACDFRIATETTLYALPARKLGASGGAGAAARLLKTVGIGRTKDIVMRARYIRGAQAYEWGVATEFVVDTELERATDALVHELLGFSPLEQRIAKKLLNDIEGSPSPVSGSEAHDPRSASCARKSPANANVPIWRRLSSAGKTS